jgi:malonyl CoA-acyl carrier protein transacylase
MEQTIIHVSGGGTFRLSEKLDCERELSLSIMRKHEEHCVYLSEDEVTDLRDRLTAILEAPVKYWYEIYQYKACVRKTISTGHVDTHGLEILRNNLAQGTWLKVIT